MVQIKVYEHNIKVTGLKEATRLLNVKGGVQSAMLYMKFRGNGELELFTEVQYGYKASFPEYETTCFPVLMNTCDYSENAWHYRMKDVLAETWYAVLDLLNDSKYEWLNDYLK